MNSVTLNARKLIYVVTAFLFRAWHILFPAEGTDPSEIVLRIKDILLGWVTPIVGSLLAIVFIIGGVMWLVAGSNQGQVRKAQMWLKNGAIGGGIVMGAVLLSDLVVAVWSSLLMDEGGGGGGGGG